MQVSEKRKSHKMKEMRYNRNVETPFSSLEI